MKLVTNIHHVSGHCGKSFKGQRSKVKGQGHSEAKCTFRRRHIERRVAVEDNLDLCSIIRPQAVSTL